MVDLSSMKRLIERKEVIAVKDDTCSPFYGAKREVREGKENC